MVEDWLAWRRLDISEEKHTDGTLPIRFHGRLRLSLNLFL